MGRLDLSAKDFHRFMKSLLLGTDINFCGLQVKINEKTRAKQKPKREGSSSASFWENLSGGFQPGQS